jgi:uncharacterized protein
LQLLYLCGMITQLAETDLQKLLQNLSPVLQDDIYVFCKVDMLPMDITPLAVFREREGITLILPQLQAQARGYKYEGVFSWITLEVHSSLFSVGLTSAVSQALAKAGISANVIAAYHHDHIFVPYTRGKEAIALLNELSGNNGTN